MHSRYSTVAALVAVLFFGSAHADQTFEYKQAGVTIAFEFNRDGAALIVVNNSQDIVSFKPEEIKITTNKGTLSPCAIHPLSLLGMGSPLLGVSVSPGTKEGYLLSSCAPLGQPLVVFEKIKAIDIGSYQVHPHGASSKKK